MWLLSCDGDLFDGQRHWLRPGSSHILGRTNGLKKDKDISKDKSVSRKHFFIRVGDTDPSDAAQLHKRTPITLEDCKSKAGTTVDGERLEAGKVMPGVKAEYVIQLGHYKSLFRLVWQPVVLTFTSVKGKGKDDPLAVQKEKLQGTDVKLIMEYVSNVTTHVVGRKRNLPAALQALLQARWVVTYEWVDALAQAMQRTSVDDQGVSVACDIEDDFDGKRPKEEDYVVPTVGEPRPRPAEFMKPKLERAEVFHGFVFVFFAQSQYEKMMPVVTSGGGKALLHEVDVEHTSVKDVEEFVKGVAGNKNRNFRLSQQTGRGGVVVVRLDVAKGDARTTEFWQSVNIALDQRSVGQGEFLDVILTLDTSGLCRALPESQGEASGGVRRQASPPRSPPRRTQPAVIDRQEEAPTMQRPTSPQPEPEKQQDEGSAAATTTKRIRRRIHQSRFKDYDDDDDDGPSQYTRPDSPSQQPSMNNVLEPSQPPSAQNMDVDEPSQPILTQPSARKRPASPPEAPEEEENIYENMFPGQAALKRRKTEAARTGDKSSFSKGAIEKDRAAVEKAAKVKKRVEKQVDVKAELKARREREEEARRKDEESLRELMEGVDISELKNLAKIEEMEVPARERQTRSANEGAHDGRWDPAWNGRKNFKKFRAQGQRTNVPRLQRVIVTLEEVPRRGHGIGEEYWLTSSTAATSTAGKSKSKSQSKSQKSQSRSQSVRAGPSNDDEGSDAGRFRRRIQRSREEDAEDAANAEIHPAEIAGHARDPGLEALVNGTPSQTMATDSQRKAAGKRAAVQQGGGPAKRARQTTLQAPARNAASVVEDDDDDDGLKFRRKRR
ncbi:hypothetical protein LTR08_005615 [Meristemomyces frigidus]|nr:hypothetical protein LTR08_005615 [Meristemomyces frigidus]